jgi:membrane associated rhomboid family serine protease
MKVTSSRSSQSRIPGFDTNAVLQLIVASGVGYVAYHLIWVFVKLNNPESDFFFTEIKPNVVLPLVAKFPQKVWTVLLYGWVHAGFWQLFSNMLWLYAFGSIIQMMVSYKQVIPLFIYGMVVSGLCYEAIQLMPGATFVGREAMLGAQGGVMALAVASLTLAPSYRIYLSPTFSIPLVIIACVFFVAIVIDANMEAPALCLLAGGALTGFGYIKLLQAGNQPGAWMYSMFDKMNAMATPGDNVRYRHNVKRNQVLSNMKGGGSKSITQSRVDEILDKINQKGYDSLSKDEREILARASKDNS